MKRSETGLAAAVYWTCDPRVGVSSGGPGRDGGRASPLPPGILPHWSEDEQRDDYSSLQPRSTLYFAFNIACDTRSLGVMNKFHDQNDRGLKTHDTGAKHTH